MRKRVFVSHQLPGDGLAKLAEHCELDVWQGEGKVPRDYLLEHAAKADGLVCLLTEKIDRALLNVCPRLSAVSSMSVGVDHVDVSALNEKKIPLGNTPGVLVDATADLAFALLLAVARRIPEGDQFVRSGEWEGVSWSPTLFLGHSVAGKTLGIVGLGEIGQAVARRAQGFGMKVLGWSRSQRDIPGIRYCSFDEVLARSDFVSINVALAEQTRNLFDQKALARMKPGAILVNTARGGIVDESALAASLETGHLAGAAFDVFEREPTSRNNPLLHAPNFVAAPHTGSATLDARTAMADIALENILAAMTGRPMPHCFNPEVYA
ncbi:MAG: D-glycerate dehydrogenase [Pseudomonadales bacterium]